jgi:hypothetical protein
VEATAAQERQGGRTDRENAKGRPPTSSDPSCQNEAGTTKNAPPIRGARTVEFFMSKNRVDVE